MNGRFFQITPAGEIVWEYVSPYLGPLPVGLAAGWPLTIILPAPQPVVAADLALTAPHRLH
jgi:hypothetical protein